MDQSCQVRVCDLFRDVYSGVVWSSPNERARAYVAFYQKVNKAKTHQHRRNTYERHKFKVRQNELVRQLNQAPTRKPTLASIVNYGLTYDPQTHSWTATTPQDHQEVVTV